MHIKNISFPLTIVCLVMLVACDKSSTTTDASTDKKPSTDTTQLPQPTQAGDPKVAKGRDLFFNETFDGNGRTCGTCHRAENNLTIDPAFIATLPNDDPLFVAEFIPALNENFESPKLMRQVGLIREHQDGFGDLPNDFNMRGVPHVFSQGISIDSSKGPQTGWSGDGAPEGTLRSFATGAVRQHFTKTNNRTVGVDFRFPTDEELDALEAFQLTLGRQTELSLPLALKSVEAIRGQELFNNEGRCSFCHFNAGANVSPRAPAPVGSGNINFNTGVENIPNQPADQLGELNPPDDGNGDLNNGKFNTPSLVEAADTGPFFHNNSVNTIEGAVGFYNSGAFRQSPAGQAGRPINLDPSQVKAVAAFLRVINALDNIREVKVMLGAIERNEFLAGEHPDDLAKRSINDIDDAIMVLSGAGLHPEAVAKLKNARRRMESASAKPSDRIKLAKKALTSLDMARKSMIN